MKTIHFSKWANLEAKIYEILGVSYFRKAVLLLEKLLHRKDNGQNTNYHIANYSQEGVAGFIKYFFYNGTIHVRNVLFLSIYIIISKCIFRNYFFWYDYLLVLLGIKDVYCVMLQRYNYLRLKERLKKMEQRRERRIEKKTRGLEKNLSNYDWKKRDEDLAFIQQLKTAIVEGKHVVISEENLETLRRCAALLSDTD